MSQPLPSNFDSQPTPEPGIPQQTTNSTLSDGQEITSGVQSRSDLSYTQVRQGAVENVQVINGNLTIGNITQVTSQRIFFKPTGIPENIPYRGAPQFVGRTQELATLHQQLQKTDRVAISTISGMGGVGKTELAIQYVRQYTDYYSGGVCWLKARASSLSSQILDFAQLNLGLIVPQELGGRLLDLPQQVNWCWQHWRPKGQVLVIFDDVTDLASLMEILPPLNRFRVLLTTRQRRLDTSFFELSLDVLEPVSALELLTILIGEARIENDRSTAEQLCQWLGYLPLGLELVGRYLAEDPDLPLTRMLERLQTQYLQDEAIDTNDQQRQKNYFLMTGQTSVRAAFELSWQELIPSISAVAQLLSLFALDVIPWKLVKFIVKHLNWTEETLDDAKKQLYKLQLIQSVGEGSYKIHPLIREFLQVKLVELGLADNLKLAFARSMAAIAKQVPKSPSLEELQNIVPVIPHLAQVAKSMTEYLSDNDLCQPFVGLARFYEAQGLYKQAEPWRLQCLSEAQARLCIKHPTVDVAATLHELAMLYKFQGRYTEAEPLFLQALELRKPIIGEHDQNLTESLYALAELYIVLGRYSAAETLLLKTLKLRQHLLGDNHPEVAETLNGLARLYGYQGRYSEAEFICEKTLKLNKQLLGENHLNVANNLNYLASLLTHKNYGKNLQNPFLFFIFSDRRVECFFTQSIEISKSLLGTDHPSVAEKLNNLAIFYYQGMWFRKAQALCKQSIDIQERSLGEDHPELAESLNTLGLVYLAQGLNNKAEAIFLQALDIKRRALGQEHPELATYLNNLGILYIAQGKYLEAESILEKSRELAIYKLGVTHPTTALCLQNSNAIATSLFIQVLFAFFSLITLLQITSQGVFLALIKVAVLLSAMLTGRLLLAPILLILLEFGITSNLFFISILIFSIPLIKRLLLMSYKFSPLSAVRWLLIKTRNSIYAHYDEILIFNNRPIRTVSIIFKLISFILQSLFATSILIVILIATSYGVPSALIATSIILIILFEQFSVTVIQLGWLCFLWLSNLEISWAGVLFLSLGFLALMQVAVKLILKWLGLKFELLSLIQRKLINIENYALNMIKFLLNLFSSKKSR